MYKARAVPGAGDDGRAAAPGRRGWRALLVPLPAAVFAALLAACLISEPAWVFDPAWLFAPLNALFLTVLPLAVAGLVLAGYRSTGAFMVLAIGAGMVAVGVGGGAVPAILLYTSGVNATVTMHNTSFLLAAACQFAALPVMGFPRLRLAGPRGLHVLVAYLSITCCLAALLVLTLTGAMPAYFAQGQGATAVRQVVLGAAALIFLLTALSWWQSYLATRMAFLQWYWAGLALFAVGMSAVAFQHVVGGALNWLGRSAQYAGALYILVAVLLTVRGGVTHGGRRLAVELLNTTLPYRPMVESAADGVIALDASGAILYWNEAASRLFSRPADQVFGATLADALAAPAHRAAVRRALSAGASGGSFELTLTGRGGRPFPAEVALYPHPGHPTVPGICLVRDISTRKAAEDQIRQLNQDLERRVAERTAELREANRELLASNRELESFSYSVSHDLRAPLRAIDGYASIVLQEQRQRLDDEHARMLDSIAANVRKMAQLIDDVLALSQVGRQILQPVPVGMTALVRSVAEEVHEESQRPGTAIEVRPLQDAPGDPALLRLVWHNLIANAAKFSAAAPQPRIRVHCALSADGSQVTYYVADNGVGFDMAYAGALFRPFHRLHGPEHPGTGIGLAIVARIVARHGGRVGAESRPGQGATFSFSLPLRPLRAPGSRSGQPASRPSQASQPSPAR